MTEWRTIVFCSCKSGTRHKFSRAGTWKGDPQFVAPCGRTMLLYKAPVGPWSHIRVPGTKKEIVFDDAFPLRLKESTMPVYRRPDVISNYSIPPPASCRYCGPGSGHYRDCPLDPTFQDPPLQPFRKAASKASGDDTGLSAEEPPREEGP